MNTITVTTAGRPGTASGHPGADTPPRTAFVLAGGGARGATSTGRWSVPRADIVQFVLAVLGQPGTIHHAVGIAS